MAAMLTNITGLFPHPKTSTYGPLILVINQQHLPKSNCRRRRRRHFAARSGEKSVELCKSASFTTLKSNEPPAKLTDGSRTGGATDPSIRHRLCNCKDGHALRQGDDAMAGLIKRKQDASESRKTRRNANSQCHPSKPPKERVAEVNAATTSRPPARIATIVPNSRRFRVSGTARQNRRLSSKGARRSSLVKRCWGVFAGKFQLHLGGQIGQCRLAPLKADTKDISPPKCGSQLRWNSIRPVVKRVSVDIAA